MENCTHFRTALAFGIGLGLGLGNLNLVCVMKYNPTYPVKSISFLAYRFVFLLILGDISVF